MLQLFVFADFLQKNNCGELSTVYTFGGKTIQNLIKHYSKMSVTLSVADCCMIRIEDGGCDDRT